jgi:hypothetical protein
MTVETAMVRKLSRTEQRVASFALRLAVLLRRHADVPALLLQLGGEEGGAGPTAWQSHAAQRVMTFFGEATGVAESIEELISGGR